jgi:hypothetical protein
MQYQENHYTSAAMTSNETSIQLGSPSKGLPTAIPFIHGSYEIVQVSQKGHSSSTAKIS